MGTHRPETFYLRTFGCQMNEHDSERIAGLLEGLGMLAAEGPDAGDVLVYNTCSIREKADTRLAGHLGEARRLKALDPSRVVVVAGCLAQSRRQGLLQDFPFVDVLVGPQSLHELPLLLDERLETGRQTVAFQEDTSVWSAELPRPAVRRPFAWVQIMTGCTNYCTYCIVPYVRGREASRPAADVVSEVRGLVFEGVREVTLLGQNVNAFGADMGRGGSEDFAALLELLSEVEGLERIRFMTSHPKDVGPRLIRRLADLAPVCEHLHLPLQSGNDRVLAAMGRGYTRDRYLALVEEVREAVPDIALTTDLIVGFPGESESEFEDTLALVEEVGFDSAFTFIYSPRPGTAAAAMPDRVSREEAESRLTRLIEGVQRSARERNDAVVGRRVEVLVEGRSRHDPVALSGRTRTFKTVNFPVGAVEGGEVPQPAGGVRRRAVSESPQAAADLSAAAAGTGDLVEVLVESATSTSLRGRLIRVLSPWAGVSEVADLPRVGR